MESYQRLERAFAEWNNLDPVGMVACSSGSSALHLALESLRLPNGCEVLTSDFNMIAVPRACTLAGLTPVLVDCTDDLLISTELMVQALTEGGSNWDRDIRSTGFGLPRKQAIGAIVLVHIYGRRYEWQRLTSELPFYGPRIIEDLAEAHGVRPHPETDAACWSFFKNKIIAGHEGGAVWFKNHEHAALARQLRCLGFTDKHDFMHVPRGHNYRMSNAHAELILDSLAKVDENVARRREAESWYDAECPDQWKMPARTSPWVYDLRIPGMTAEQQDHAVRLLQEHGIQARHAFRPMSWQEEYRNGRLVRGPEHVAARMGREVIYLPLMGVIEEDAKLAFQILRGLLGSLE